MNCRTCDRAIFPASRDVPYKDKHCGRGLCGHCYAAQRYAGGLPDHERTTRTSVETVAEVEFLHSIGLTRLEAAQRLGVTSDAIYRAYRRTQTHARSRA
ncbi:MAG TPA: hypothetical protein VIQ30_02065 [Pseudonocardia sp.]